MVRAGIDFALRVWGNPLRLLSRQSRHRSFDWGKPLRFVVRAMKLRQEKRTECNRRRRGRGRRLRDRGMSRISQQRQPARGAKELDLRAPIGRLTGHQRAAMWPT